MRIAQADKDVATLATLRDYSGTTTTGTTTRFPFKLNIYTALLTTTDKSLTGDLSSKMLSATVEVEGGSGTFQHRDGGSCTPADTFVRFFFVSPKRPVRPALLVALRCRPIPASTRSSGGRTRSTCNC